MTRFARAKGSKASNQRIPEEATPWSELKQKITKNTNDSEWKETKDETNWKEVINHDKKLDKNVNSVWCDFSDNEANKNNDQQLRKNKKKKKFDLEVKAVEESKKCDFSDNDQQLRKNKKKKKFDLEVKAVEESKKYDFSDNEANKNNDQQLRKNKKKKKIDLEVNAIEESKKSRKRKRDAERTVVIPETSKSMNSLTTESEDFKDHIQVNVPVTEGPLDDKAASKSHLKGNLRFKGSSNWSVTGKEHKQSSFQSLPHKRRKTDHGDQKIDINGQEIIVTRLDGFYIRKEDAERIRNLEKDLIKKGVPKEEIRAVVKKERRNAEKSLARQKKKVCFHCRKGGHNLSSCPKLSESMGSGICYKCGSTEHSHIECKVSTGYKFAVCFICKEEGHIARECPDNPRGLYPQGGGCKLCGDVTHLRRDCPQATREKPSLDLIQDDLDTLDTNPVDTTPSPKRKNKIIKFK